MVIFISLVLLLGVIPAIIASTKSKNVLLWWIYGCALFPIALVHSIITKADRSYVEGTAVLRALRSIGTAVIVGCLALVAFGVLAIVLIVQHGGA